jgi:hypothetical protein
MRFKGTTQRKQGIVTPIPLGSLCTADKLLEHISGFSDAARRDAIAVAIWHAWEAGHKTGRDYQRRVMRRKEGAV